MLRERLLPAHLRGRVGVGKVRLLYGGGEEMKYKVTLEITTESDPNEWNWHEMLDLSQEGEDTLDAILIEEEKG